MILIGIDPGKTGAIAIKSDDFNYEVYDMPDNAKELYDFFLQLKARADIEGHRCMAYLELARDFGTIMGRLTAWNFSGQYHQILMALVINDIPFDVVDPKHWQKSVGVSYRRIDNNGKSKKLSSPQKKKIGFEKAKQLFPDVNFTLPQADSLNILRHGSIIEKR